MTPTPDATVIVFDPHIVWAIIAVGFAIIVGLIGAVFNIEGKPPKQ